MGPLACVASVSVRFSFSDSRSISHAAKTFRFLGNPVTRSFFAPKPLLRRLWALCRIRSHGAKNTLLPGMANGAEGQGKQRDIIQKARIISFKVPPRRLPSSKVFFASCDHILQRAHSIL